GHTRFSRDWSSDVCSSDLLFGAEGLGWLTDESTAMWSVVLTTVWWTVGFNFLLYLAALQSIPGHLYEAAALDGAGAWARLRHVTDRKSVVEGRSGGQGDSR